MKSFLSIASAALLASQSTAFTATKRHVKSVSSLRMAADEDEAPASSRRAFFADVASTTAAVAGAAATGSVVQGPLQPAYALGGGLKKVNARLAAYGLPQVGILPDGFSPLLDIWGKGFNRFPLLVYFSHPLDWVVTLPSQDENGEDGTIQAGEYAKGDTATLFVYEEPGNVENIGEQPKEFYANVLQKAISQKGASIYQNFKVTQIQPVKGGYKDQTYVICDFKYQLVTGAGFEVDRKAVASITSQGKAVEALWCAATAVRYKKLEPKLRDIAGSFRVYSDGLDLVVNKRKYDDDFL